MPVILDPRHRKVTPEIVRAYFYEWKNMDAAATSTRTQADEFLKSVRTVARASGVERVLDELLAPPPPPPPPEPRVRCRVTQDYMVVRAGKYGPEGFSGAAGSVVDLPVVIRRKLGALAEDVAPTTPISHRPLPPERAAFVDTLTV